MMVRHLCFIPLPRVNERISIRPPLHSRAWMNQPSRRHPGPHQPSGGRLENPSSRQSKNLPLSLHSSHHLPRHQENPSSQQSKNLQLFLHPSRRLPCHQENHSSQQSKSLGPHLSCRVPPAPGNSAPSGLLSASQRQRGLCLCFRNTGPRPPARWQERCITCQWRLT